MPPVALTQSAPCPSEWLYSDILIAAGVRNGAACCVERIGANDRAYGPGIVFVNAATERVRVVGLVGVWGG